jgi:hypothetical protein
MMDRAQDLRTDRRLLQTAGLGTASLAGLGLSRAAGA